VDEFLYARTHAQNKFLHTFYYNKKAKSACIIWILTTALLFSLIECIAWYNRKNSFKGGIMFTLPELPYAYDALEPAIDEQTMKIHHDKHHGAYVKNLNDALVGQDALLSLPVEELIADLSKVSEAVRAKVRNNAGGHANHSLFWQIMGPQSTSSAPTGALLDAITSAFGSVEKLQEAVNAAGVGRFGSGWAWVVVDGGKLVVMDTPNQDSPLMEGKTPILGVDVWEHAYYLKYQNMRADYLKAWWTVVNWKEVERRFNEVV
jgi:Fe-Mn family superoxide dismutase